ncbi:MAG: hypothetical protein EA420_19625 [Candidatus Competibacteraceae bacterium]|nr:MAG: hypothetical protein EA420_19625 [Candidatus Competibacteraceae bacterium]
MQGVGHLGVLAGFLLPVAGAGIAGSAKVGVTNSGSLAAGKVRTLDLNPAGSPVPSTMELGVSTSPLGL